MEPSPLKRPLEGPGSGERLRSLRGRFRAISGATTRGLIAFAVVGLLIGGAVAFLLMELSLL